MGGPRDGGLAQWSAATGEAAYVSRTCTPTAVIVSLGPTRWGTDGQYSHNPVDGPQIRFLPGRPPRLPIAFHEVGHAFGAEHTGAGVMHPERAAGWCIDAVSAATVGGRSTCKD